MVGSVTTKRILVDWNLKKVSIFLLKVFFTLILFWFLINNDVIQFQKLGVLVDNLPLAILAAVISLATIPIAAYRWQLLLSVQGIHVPLLTATKIVGASNATSIFFAGLVGGEALRATWIMGAIRSNRTAALFSLPFDRICGLLGLLAIGSLAVVMRWDELSARQEIATLATLTVSIFIALFFAILLGHWTYPYFRIQERTAHWKNTGKIRHLFWTSINALSIYRDQAKCLIICFLLSLLTNGLTIVAFLIIASFIPTGVLDMIDIVFAFVLSLIANIFSITPGGIGIGEGAFEALCRIIAGTSSETNYGTLFFSFRITSWIPLAVILGYSFFSKWSARAPS
jgi:glycosyltransferase 2 family protein